MLNVGPPELILIFVIALVIVGPERLPELGRMIGKGMRELRKMQDEVRDLVNTGMGDDFKQTTTELKKTAAELKSATDVRSAFRDDPPRPRPKPPARAPARPSDDRDERPPPDDAGPGSSQGPPETPPSGDPAEEPKA